MHRTDFKTFAKDWQYCRQKFDKCWSKHPKLDEICNMLPKSKPMFQISPNFDNVLLCHMFSQIFHIFSPIVHYISYSIFHIHIFQFFHTCNVMFVPTQNPFLPARYSTGLLRSSIEKLWMIYCVLSRGFISASSTPTAPTKHSWVHGGTVACATPSSIPISPMRGSERWTCSSSTRWTCTPWPSLRVFSHPKNIKVYDIFR